MFRVKASDVLAGLAFDAKNELRTAAGRGGVVSRAEQEALSGSLNRAVEDVRVAKGSGARVSISEAASAFETSAKSALAAVNTVGPTWLSASETRKIADPDLQTRAWAVRARVSPLSAAALEARMSQHVLDNAEPSPFERTEKPYPSVAGGREGLFAHRLTGTPSARIGEIAQLWAAKLQAPDPFPGFDPSKSELLVVRTTHYDRDNFIVSAVDRATGAVGAPFTLEMGQIFYFVDEADFTRLVGSKESFGADEYSYWKLDYHAVIDRLLTGTKRLDIGNPYVGFDPAQGAGLTQAANAVINGAGFSGLTLRMAPAVVAAQEALPNNQITHAQALGIALEALTTSTVDGSSPLSICLQVLMDAANTTTLTPEIEAAAVAKLTALMKKPSTALRALDLDEKPEGAPGTRNHWAIQLEIPELSDDTHWAIIDRTGNAPVQLISFN